MQYPEFIHAAKAEFGVDTEQEAIDVTRAVLHTLTYHLAGNAADNMGAQLPGPLLDIIREVPAEERDQGQRFKVEEFYTRVAAKLRTDDATAERYTRQFFALLGQMVTPAEYQKIEKTLSEDYATLFASV